MTTFLIRGFLARTPGRRKGMHQDVAPLCIGAAQGRVPSGKILP